MESKKDETLKEYLEKEKVDNEWLVGLVLVAGLFGDWGKDRKYDELDKRISKLETKTEMLEKIILK